MSHYCRAVVVAAGSPVSQRVNNRQTMRGIRSDVTDNQVALAFQVVMIQRCDTRTARESNWFGIERFTASGQNIV